MQSVIYDTGALLAAERRRRSPVWSFHDEAMAGGIRPVVPVVVLSQAWRGGPQPQLSRLLRGCHVQPDDERTGRAAGVACAEAGTSDVVDSIVVVTALAQTSVVVTSDPHDLNRIADALNVKLALHVV